jgi:serine/threonine protein kinase
VVGADRSAREIASLTRLAEMQHENLLTIHHVGQANGCLYYTMDLADDVSGRPASTAPDYRPATLEVKVERGPLAPPECLKHIRELLAGLAALHAAGLVHRDVKPANCLFVRGQLKLADLGLLTPADSSVSRVGTPIYMPPDGRMDARADVYAAGLTLYEMYSGFPASRFPHLKTAAAHGLESETLVGLNLLVLRACQPDPNKRFPNAQEMLAALDTLPTAKKPVVRATKRAIAVLGAVLAATILTWLGLRSYMPPRVDVDFITTPFEAEVYLDDVRAADQEGRPFRTPCTIPGLVAGTHSIRFKHEGLPDLDAGRVDLLKQREVRASWDETSRVGGAVSK